MPPARLAVIAVKGHLCTKLGTALHLVNAVYMLLLPGGGDAWAGVHDLWVETRGTVSLTERVITHLLSADERAALRTRRLLNNSLSTSAHELQHFSTLRRLVFF